MADKAILVGRFTVRLEGDLRGFEASLSAQHMEEGLDVVHVVLSSPRPADPPAVQFTWQTPTVDVQGCWSPAFCRNRGLRPDWAGGVTSRSTTTAPVMCLHNQQNQNRLTFACSDALNAINVRAGVNEESAEFHCRVGFFGEPHPPIDRYEANVLLDSRPVPYYEALDNVQRWWAAQPGYAPSAIPEIARLPMYSTWYSFHQHVEDTAAIERQCRLAKELGCEAVIVDDGWQTTDSGRGYAYCGDWEPLRMPDIRAHVARVHALGMKFLLWYSVPYVGKHSKAFQTFQGKYLHMTDRGNTAVLDPRFPEVREYLIQLYEWAMREWDLDGFKLDFVDSFNPGSDSPQEAVGGRDYASVPQAADRLLSDVLQRLRRIKPETMIEFRQSYTGPLMRKYGNIFRAGDCPDDAITNRLRTIDIRLLCGNTAAHADMVMWHRDEPVESAALQLLNILFAVPQISVRLDRLPEAHREMLRFWLAFWRQHRDVLLDGKFQPLHPEAFYPVVMASTPAKRLIAVYGDAVVSPGLDFPPQLLIVNASCTGRVVLELDQPFSAQIQTRDCRGAIVAEQARTLPAGVHSLPIPPSGVAFCQTNGG